MKSITLEENELEVIGKLYQSELEEVEKYVARIKETLAKLKASKPAMVEVAVTEQVKFPKKRGRKSGKKVAVDKPAPKKRGRKPKTTIAELSAVIESLLVEAPIKRGRKAKEVATGTLKKRGRKPKNVSAALKTLPETLDSKFELYNSKPGSGLKKKKKRSRRKRGSPIFGKKVLQAPVAKPITFSESGVEGTNVQDSEVKIPEAVVPEIILPILTAEQTE